jgi:hypothetical protein
MNIQPDALTAAVNLAENSGKVDWNRLSKARKLVTGVVKTLAVIHTDGSRAEEYWVPGSAHTGYSITVRDGRMVGPCTCKDYQVRGTPYCKHTLSIMLIIRSGELVPGSVTASPVVGMTERVSTLLADPDYRAKTIKNMFQDDD